MCIINFKQAMIISSALRVLGKPTRKLGLTQRHAIVVMCSTFRLGCDNFIDTRVVRFLKPFLDFSF